MLSNEIKIQGGKVDEKLSFFELSGPDTYSYLNGQTPNQVPKEKECGLPNVLLSIKGRLIASFFLYCQNEDKYIAVVRSEKETEFLERLDQFHISEDFEIKKIEKNYEIVVGEDCIHKSYQDEMPYWFYGLPSKIIFEEIDEESVSAEKIKTLNGFHEKLEDKLFTETRYFDFCYDKDKGCFPGQETVAKITNNRGAAYYPTLLEGQELPLGILSHNGERIGEVLGQFEGMNLVTLKRIHRVNGKKLELDGKNLIVKTFQTESENQENWAQELYDLANEAFLKNDLETAKKYFRYAILNKDDFADAYESLGVIYGREGNFDKGVQLMQQLAKIDPNSVLAHTNLSLFYMKMGKIEEAEEEKSKAMLKEFERAGEAIDPEEEKRKNEENLKRREGMFQQVLEIDPEDEVALFGIVQIHFEKENYEEVVKKSNQLLKNNKKHFQSYLYLSKSLVELKKLEEAKKYLLKGIDLSAEAGQEKLANEMQDFLTNIC